MGELVLGGQIRVAATPVDAFSRFGSGDPANGWLFGCETASLKPGRLVRLSLPVGGLSGVQGIARIAAASPYRRIDLINETPWFGRVACKFKPLRSGGTRVTVTATINEREIERLAEELGLVRPASARGEVSVGLLTSLSGPSEVLGRSTVNCAQLAVDEVNAEGGVAGHQVRLVVADDATIPAVGALAMRRLLRTERLSAVIGMHSSATYAATAPQAVTAGVPYLYTPASELQPQHPLLVCFGETPSDQLRLAVPRMAAKMDGSRWFLTGNDYSWPRAIGSTAKAIVQRLGQQVAGEGYLPVGSTQFEPLLDAISNSGADFVISSFIGQDHIRFERQFVASGLRETTRTFAPLLDDAVVEHLGADAEGIWNVLGYFEGLDTRANRDFLARYRARFGDCSPPVSAGAEGVYEALHTWALACRRSRGCHASAVIEGLRRVTFRGPRLRGGSGEQSLLLGEAQPQGVSILDQLPGVSLAS